MDRKLIYDVGVCDGSDTAYYLRRDFNVVGIEASPVMIDALRRRFASNIADGTLTILDVGVADAEGELQFWVCDDVPEWSSFDQELASRNGASHHSVIVKTRRFSDIVSEYGVPLYCKIDIEGQDRRCVESLLSAGDVPEYISIEMAHADASVDLELLHRLGYRRFKIISQSVRAQPIRWLTSLSYALPDRPSRFLRRVERKLRGVTSDADWKFSKTSSGPFGEGTPGRWRSRAEVLALWQHLHDVDARYGRAGLRDWYDIHATR